jgi:hypothetical protein
MSDDNSNPTEKALNEMKRSVDQAMSRTEDAMARMGYDISAASRVADDYRTKVFEYMRINMNAAIDYANNLASVKWPTDLMGLTLGNVQDQALTAPALKEMSSAAKAAEDYRSRMFQFMKTNLNMMLEYAERLATVKTPTEFVEVSTNHARKQFDTITTQTNELRALAQKLSTWNKDSASS